MRDNVRPSPTLPISLMKPTALITRADAAGFVAVKPRTATTSQGEAVEQAIASLRESTADSLSALALASEGRPRVAMVSAARHAQAAPAVGSGGCVGGQAMGCEPLRLALCEVAGCRASIDAGLGDAWR